MKNLRPGRVLLTSVFAGLPLAITALVGVSYYAFAAIPPVPVPPQNPITEQKRVLGKILFFEEQLSTSNTVACATCHQMSRGGNDQRTAINPGPDNTPGTPDDRRGSPGVIRMDSGIHYTRDTVFNFNPQVTGRAANSPINAAFNVDSFWDGRARTFFTDPQTSAVVIPNNASLESQAVGPITNSVEMGHDAINWDYVLAKLPNVTPLQLASNLPPDVAAVLASKPSYPQLFAAAFGDGQVTSARIAMAIATYERTLLSNQAPFDAFDPVTNPGALTAAQRQGLQTFQNNCQVCHNVQNGLFSDHTFRNIGLRPTGEDLGRQIVTGSTADRGKFKVPSLRNVGLKNSFMHNGQIATLTDVVRFYVQAPGSAPRFNDNIDPAVLQITPQSLPAQQETPLVDFLANALTDPRVANQQFPFDRPTLFTERPADRSSQLGGGVPGTGGLTPATVANQPAYVGNMEFRAGVFNARPGATATLYASLTAPVNGRINTDMVVGTTVTGSTGQTSGVATVTWQMTPASVQGGQVYFLQWVVDDPAAVGGQARSGVTRLPIFCGAQGCPNPCGTSDFNGDGDFGTDQDIEAFFACLAGSCCPTCSNVGSDFNGDGDFGTDQDIEAFFRVLGGGNC